MNWAVVIPVGIGIAVLLSIALVAIDVSGQISRQEELDEVEFYFVRDVQSITSAAAQRWFTRIARAETAIRGYV